MIPRSRLALAALILLASPLALATNTPEPPPNPGPHSPVINVNAGAGADADAAAISGSKSAAESASLSAANSDSKSDAKSDAKSDSNSTSSSSSDNANTNTSENANDSSASLTSTNNYKSRLQAPSISAPPVYASGTCAMGWSAGISIPGAGASGGKSKPDANCDRRELVRVVTPLNPWLALKVACEDPVIVDMVARGVVTNEACLYAPPAPPPAPPAPAPIVADPISRGEVGIMIDRAFKLSSQK